jgi:hypothetical protein
MFRSLIDCLAINKCSGEISGPHLRNFEAAAELDLLTERHAASFKFSGCVAKVTGEQDAKILGRGGVLVVV